MRRYMVGVLIGLFVLTVAQAKDLKPVNTETMIPSRCYAGSRPDKHAPGGYGRSDNAPKKLDRTTFPENAVSLVALPTESVPFREFDGFRLLLVNRTKQEVAFSAEDSRLPIIREALDEKGKWRAIEYLPESWCGNSFHRVFLPANNFWEFRVPRYEGSFKTKIRFVLQESKKAPIYSNEYEGAINPSQFNPTTTGDLPVKRKPEPPSPYE